MRKVSSGPRDLTALLTTAAGAPGHHCRAGWRARSLTSSHQSSVSSCPLSNCRADCVRFVAQGLDFFFGNRQHAVKLVDFLQARCCFELCLLSSHAAWQRNSSWTTAASCIWSPAHVLRLLYIVPDVMQAVVPCKFHTAKQLVSHNIHSSTYNYKYTFSVEIVPVCKVRR